MIDIFATDVQGYLSLLGRAIRADWVSEQSLTREVVAPIFAAVFAAYFGARFGAQLANKSANRAQAIERFNSVLSASALAALICSRSLEFKKYFVRETVKKFNLSKEKTWKAINSTAPSKIFSENDFIDIPPQQLPSENLGVRIDRLFGLDASTIAQVETLKQAVEALSHFIEERRQLIVEYRSTSSAMSEQEKTYWYYGFTLPGKGRDSRFSDNLRNIEASVDDAIFHSRMIYEKMIALAVKERLRLPREIQKSSRISPANFSMYEDEKLFPDEKAFSSWIGRGKDIRVTKWWWSKKRKEAALLRSLSINPD